MRVGTRTRFDRVRRVVSWAEAARSETQMKNNAAARGLPDFAIILENLIERMYQLMRPLQIIGCPATLTFLQ